MSCGGRVDRRSRAGRIVVADIPEQLRLPGYRIHSAETRQNRPRWLDACRFGGDCADEAAHGPDGGHMPNTRRMVEGHAPLTIRGAFADGRPVRRVDAHARASASVAMIASMLPLQIARSMRWFMRWMD